MANKYSSVYQDKITAILTYGGKTRSATLADSSLKLFVVLKEVTVNLLLEDSYFLLFLPIS
jgi:hypothetical protein